MNYLSIVVGNFWLGFAKCLQFNAQAAPLKGGAGRGSPSGNNSRR